ncbi:MAG: hypothetical protein KBB83_03085 [Alphaproteobacteria bacterium]|nr:hypothetical protein [Alphaproteobacteria bacterium]
MKPQAIFIIEDDHVQHQENGQTLIYTDPSACTTPLKSKRIDLRIHVNEMHLSQTSLPLMNHWDQMRFCRQKKIHTNPENLYGLLIHSHILYEISCPITAHLKKWFDYFASQRIPINSLTPHLIQACSPENTIVLSQHSNGFRHTAYVNQKPIFTRWAQGNFSPEDVFSTMNYLRNQYNLKDFILEGYLDLTHYRALAENCPQNISCIHHPIETATHTNFISFLLPSTLKKTNETQAYKKLALAMTTANTLLLATAFWQYQDQSAWMEKLDRLDHNLSQLSQNTPKSQGIPENFLNEIHHPSPIALLKTISENLSADLVVSALKWENKPTQESLWLEISLIHEHDDPELSLNEIQELYTNLQEALPQYTILIHSLPYASSEQETFAGSASGLNMNIEGDLTKARLQLTRKKSA